MTENQENQLFKTLETLVSGVNKIQSDVGTLKSDVGTLKSDVGTLKSDVGTLKSDVEEIKITLNEHSQILKRLDAKTDSIAETVMNHEVRLISTEKNIEELQERVH